MADSVRPWLYLDKVELSSNSCLEDFERDLLPLARPQWRGKELAVNVFNSGITNNLMAIYLKEKGFVESREEVVLLRVNGEGSEKLVDRIDELHCMLTLNEFGLGPPLYAQLNNGLCYGFFPGRQLEVTEVTEQKVWRKVAELMAALHVVNIPDHFQKRKPQVWAKVRMD